CPSQFATRRTLFHVLVGCGLLMLKVSRLKLPVIWLLVSMWLNTLTKSQIDRKSGSAGMPRPISYAVFCLKKKKNQRLTCALSLHTLHTTPSLLYLMLRPPPPSPLFPYTTLFRSMPIAVRYTQDAFSRSGWLWPVDAKGEPLKATSYMAVGFYVAKYVNKKSDMDLAAKGLGAKEWNNSLKTKLSLLP